jgi:hypothetical protein
MCRKWIAFDALFGVNRIVGDGRGTGNSPPFPRLNSIEDESSRCRDSIGSEIR